MRWIYTIPLRWRSLLRRSRVEEELRDEFQFHLDRHIEQNLARGMTPEDARYAALRAMDGPEQRKEECRDRRRVNFLDQLAQDLRLALRTLRKKPAFTLIAVLSLALGIGVNTAVFSLLNSLLMTKLPVRDPDKLYQLIATHRTTTSNSFSYANYQKLQTSFDIFEGVAIWSRRDFDFQVDQTRLNVHGALVSGNFYDFLGVAPAIGRVIESADDTAAGASVAVLGYGFWQREFRGDAGVLGKVIRIEGAPFTVIGVTPAGFGGAEIDYPRDVILPLHAIKLYDPKDRNLENPGSYFFSALARLKPGVTAESARPVLRDLWPRLEQGEALVAADNWRPKVDIAPGGFGVSRTRAEFSRPLLVIMALVSLVLLMMCANLASLLLARALGRRKEVAVRLAIGANRWRLIRQSVTEAFLLASIGGGAGILLASWLTKGLLLFLPATDTGFLSFRLDWRMLAFAAVVSFATALLFGLLPALQAVRVPLNVVMSEVGRVPGAGRRPWLARAVVALQVAVSLVLVVGSLLFAKSLQNISKANLGFRHDHLYLLGLNPGRAGIRGEQNDLLYKTLLSELNETPGIASASLSRITPVSGAQWWDSAAVSGYVPSRDETTTIYLNQVAPAYFQTLGIPILEGREFRPADDKSARRVAVVNQSFVRHFFQGRSALGRTIDMGYGLSFPTIERYAIFRDLKIVGVVADTKYSDPREDPKDLVYLASYQAGLFDITGSLDIRLAPGVSARQAEAQIRAIVNKHTAGLDVQLHSFDSAFDRILQGDRMVALLSGIFGLLGMTLACVGLYGVMMQAVTSRSSEIGIRMTLGARGWQVEWMILRETLLLIAGGVFLGVPLALALARLASGLVYGVRPWDPQIILGAVGLMAIVGALSAWQPARRASRIDPMIAVRHE